MEHLLWVDEQNDMVLIVHVHVAYIFGAKLSATDETIAVVIQSAFS